MKKLFGFTLIEVVISWVLFALILLGFDVMQLTAMRINQSAYCQTVAAIQLKSIKERMKALKMYEGFDEQIDNWNEENRQVLPAGFGYVIGHYPFYSFEICWGRVKRCLYEKNIRVDLN